MQTAATRIIVSNGEPIAVPGGPNGPSEPPGQPYKHEPQWHGVGILYALESDGKVEFRVLYEGHISQAMKEQIYERFGVTAIQWQI